MEIINCNTFNRVLVRVQKGDTLDIISKKYNISQNGIVRNNSNIDLYDGELIIIDRNVGNLHIVKPMETLNSIACRYNMAVDEIVKINELKSNRLFVGQMIQVK